MRASVRILTRIASLICAISHIYFLRQIFHRTALTSGQSQRLPPWLIRGVITRRLRRLLNVVRNGGRGGEGGCFAFSLLPSVAINPNNQADFFDSANHARGVHLQTKFSRGLKRNVGSVLLYITTNKAVMQNLKLPLIGRQLVESFKDSHGLRCSLPWHREHSQTTSIGLE